jgi:hypothetical protein
MSPYNGTPMSPDDTGPKHQYLHRYRPSRQFPVSTLIGVHGSCFARLLLSFFLRPSSPWPPTSLSVVSSETSCKRSDDQCASSKDTGQTRHGFLVPCKSTRRAQFFHLRAISASCHSKSEINHNRDLNIIILL